MCLYIDGSILIVAISVPMLLFCDGLGLGSLDSNLLYNKDKSVLNLMDKGERWHFDFQIPSQNLHLERGLMVSSIQLWDSMFSTYL